MNIYSCLLALLLACNVTAEIIYQGVKEKQQVSLSCPRSVEGKVTWSREIDGSKVDLFAIDGEREEILYDPQRTRYGSTSDKSLIIISAAVSDSGTYYCNNEPAAQLTVIPSEEKRTPTTTTTTTTLTRRQTAAATNMTTTEKQNDVTTTSTSAPTKTLYLVLGIVIPFVLLLFIITTYCSLRQRFKRQEEEYPIYDEIQEGGLQLEKRVESSGRPSATYSLAGFPGTSVTNELPYSLITNPVPDGNKQDFKKQTTQPNQNDPTYYTIPDLPPMGNKTGTSVTNELPYYLITNPVPDGNKQGFRTQTIQSNQNDPTYHTISDPAPTGNRTDALTN